MSLSGQSGANTDLTFTTANWNTPQTVTVTAVDDSTAESAELVTLTLTTVDADTVAEYDSVNPDDVVVTIPANDAVGVTVSQSTLSVVEGSTGTFTVVLDKAPSGDVKVRVAESSADVSLAGQSGDNADLDLTFTTANWMTAQTVTVTAVDDSTAESAELVTLTLTTVDADTVAEYDSVNPDDVVVTIPANDAVGVTVSQTTLSVVEGLTGTFTVVLDNAPSGDVKVRVAESSAEVLSLIHI